MVLSGPKLQWVINLTSGFAFLLFGYDQGVMGGLLSLESFQARFNYPPPNMQGFMVASYDLGCLFGAIWIFFFGNSTGRRWAIIFGCIVLCVGAVLQAASYSRAQFIVGRIVAGLGVGAVSATVPVYISECSKARHRGIMIIMQLSIVVLGIIISAYTNFGLVFCTPSLEGTEGPWRIALALQIMFPIFVFCLMPFCVESPRWLASHGAPYEEVAKVLALLEGRGVTANTPHIHAQAVEIVAIAAHEAEVEVSWKEAFGGGELQNGRRLLLSGVVVGLLQQITGVNAIVYYSVVVFQQVGLSPRTSFIMGGVGSICMLIGTALPALWIERAGRRKSLMISAWLEVFTMGGIAASIAYGINHPEHKVSSGWAATVFILLFEFSFGLGCCPIPFVYAPEVNSLRARHKGGAVQSMGLWSGCFLIVMVTPAGVANLSWRFYLIWMIITLGFIPLIWALCPETAGRTLEDMDYFFKKYQNKWYIRDVAYEWVEKDDVQAAGELEIELKLKGQHEEVEHTPKM